MKWYNYKDKCINLENCVCISLFLADTILFCQTFDEDEGTLVDYDSPAERDAEFAKIKILMGIDK